VEIPVADAPECLDELHVVLEQPCFFRGAMVAGGADPAPLAIRLHAVELVSSAAGALPEEPAKGPEDVVQEPYRFRLGDYSGAAFDTNWSADDTGGFWATSHASSFTLPLPRFGASAQLQLSLVPARVLTVANGQRLTVVANGFVVSQGWYLSETTIVIPLPSEVFTGQESLRITLLMPDAIGLGGFKNDQTWPRLGFLLLAATLGPCDIPANLAETVRDDEIGETKAWHSSAVFESVALSDLPEAVSSTLGRPLTQILTAFESLGDNCSFGIVQRKAGLEVLGLLRFGTSPINAVLQGLDDRFEALSRKSEFSMGFGDGVPREHLVRVERYGLQWHTFRYEDGPSAETVFEENVVKLGFLRRKFNNGLAAGRKTYVVARTAGDRRNLLMPTPEGRFFRYFGREPLRLAEALALWRALSRNGPRVLLYIVPAAAGHPGGSVDCLAPGLYRGYSTNLVISDRLDVEDHADWLRIVANCWILMQAAENG
jgi:hypothetical protein